MDIVAHMLWAGAGTVLAARRVTMTRRTVAGVIALAALPDLLQFLPILAWAGFGDGTWQALVGHAAARPGQEPGMPAAVALVSHHLHCMTHSAIVAGVTTEALWLVTRTLWLPLLGWWSHILMDVWTHSADFYPVPVLYPITYRGFDGLAWNEPWFMVLNYAALGLFFAWAIVSGVRSSGAARAPEQPIGPVTGDRTSCRIEMDQAAAPRSENNESIPERRSPCTSASSCHSTAAPRRNVA